MDWMKCTAVELGEKIKAGEVTAMEAAMAAMTPLKRKKRSIILM